MQEGSRVRVREKAQLEGEIRRRKDIQVRVTRRGVDQDKLVEERMRSRGIREHARQSPQALAGEGRQVCIQGNRVRGRSRGGGIQWWGRDQRGHMQVRHGSEGRRGNGQGPRRGEHRQVKHKRRRDRSVKKSRRLIERGSTDPAAARGGELKGSAQGRKTQGDIGKGGQGRVGVIDEDMGSMDGTLEHKKRRNAGISQSIRRPMQVE
jgi:hypothetical protein